MHVYNLQNGLSILNECKEMAINKYLAPLLESTLNNLFDLYLTFLTPQPHYLPQKEIIWQNDFKHFICTFCCILANMHLV